MIYQNNLISSLRELILEAGTLALSCKRNGLVVECKPDLSPVTNGDKEISNLIYHRLSSLSPHIPIICEERLVPNNFGKAFWLIDPIDGTKSYIKGESTYTINIALIHYNQPIIGLIYQPDIDKLYYTDPEGNLRIEKDGKEVAALQHKNTDYVAVVSSHHLSKKTKNFLNQYQFQEIIKISSSIKLCLIAEGIADIYPRFEKIMEWDIAAGHALIKASGGNIFDDSKQQIKYGHNNFIISNFIAYSLNALK